MTAALNKVLRKPLSNLTDADFKRFKHCLRDQDDKFEWNSLVKADIDDTVDMMVDLCGNSRCGGVMVAILQQMNHNQQAMNLEKDLTKMGVQSSNPLQAGGGGGVNVNVAAHSGGMVNGGVPNAQQGAGPEFFNKHKWDLETRLGALPALLIYLERNSVLSRLEREQVESKSTSQEKNHILISMMERKGAMAQDKFYQALQAHEAYLVQDLQRSAM
ncbi:uncharacterized protein LOC134085247 [Sardina pilchardus]|uniref:uncharacterized protein LOC134085247 n=1 Tax=Sardina pilchardus TaxID=27697 RepID=UPI002E137BE4